MTNAFFQPFGFVWMILWWAIAIAAISATARFLLPHRHDRTCTRDTAVSIVKERYARGEITKDQFESMKKDLES